MSSSKDSSLPSALLESLRSIGYTLDTALADIIDNCITAKANSISIRFLWNNGKPWIAVCDDGFGMSPKELIEAMRFGFRSPGAKRDPEDLGRFGLGMKTASISQCRHLTVVSKSAGKTSACEWNLDAMISHGASEWNARTVDPQSLPNDGILADLIAKYLADKKTGTIVLWQNLDVSLGDPEESTGEKRFSAHMDSARKHLELVFHRFLAPRRHRRVAINFNDTQLEAFDPFGSSIPARQELPAERIRMQAQVLTIQPYVLPHRAKAASISEYEKHAGEEGYLHNQGFYVYRNRRLIIKATWFRLIPKDELNKLIRIRVDIPNSLDHLWRLDIKKSQANPPETVRRELKRIISKISGAGRIVFTNRATRLRDRKITPVWKREVVEGKIHYGVNEEHPLVKALLKDLPKARVESLRACFELLNATFPYDMYYADAADDKTEFATPGWDDERVRQVGIQLVRALRSCGFDGPELRRQLENAEFFKCSSELIEEILNMKATSGTRT
jgi:hypothetical protein